MKTVNNLGNGMTFFDFSNVSNINFKKSINLFGLIIILMISNHSIYSKNINLKELNTTQQDSVKKKKVGTDDKMTVDLKELQNIAEYPGGLEKFYSKIATNFDENEIDYDGFSKINVSFVIEKDGSMSGITVNNSNMSKSMKKSIVKVLKSIKTKWSPAIINDQPVRTGYDLPIVFNAK